MATLPTGPPETTNQVLLSQTIAGPDALPDAERARKVGRWQGYLVQRGYYHGDIDGIFGPETAAATQTFQEKYRWGIWGRRLAPHWGELDEATARFARYPDGRPFSFEPLFQIGPDKTGDLREDRPYFVVPVDETPEVLQSLRDRIVDWVIDATQEPAHPLLTPNDLRDPAALASALRDADAATDPVWAWMRGHLTCDTQRRLAQYQRGTPVPVSLKRTLVSELNALLMDECLYDPARFDADVWRPGGTLAARATRNPQGRELILLNRELLQDRYPGLIAPLRRKGPVTDIYLLSHGWHRNFYGAVAAYDQLLSRISLLLHRRRIEVGERYHPLFLTLHWHSDPGQDGWVDRSGRRHKEGFLQNAERLFERPSNEEERYEDPENRFTDAFEDIFQWFSRLSAPDTRALQDTGLAAEAKKLAGRLDRFRLQEAPDAEASDKVAAAWSCYHRAPIKRFLLDQPVAPDRFVLPWTAFMDTAKFLIGLVGVTAAAGLLFRFWRHLPLLGPAMNWLGARWGELVAWLHNVGLRPALATPAAFVLVYAGLSGLAWIYLRFKARRGLRDEKKPRHGVPVLRLIAWLLLAVPCALPLLVYLFLTYFLGGLWLRGRYSLLKSLGYRGRKLKVYASSLFDERLGDRNAPITARDRAVLWLDRRGIRRIRGWHPRYYLATWARRPIRLLRQGLARDHDGQGLVDVLDNQFAFWEMQIAGAQAGRDAARFLAGLFAELHDALDERAPDDTLVKPWSPRIHFLGHSFGGLVVANAARHLKLDPECDSVIPHVHSLCLLQAAIASTWFEEEDWIRSFVTGGLGCIYSAYDTANGFYYPVANNARLAGGFVGLYKVGNDVPTATLPRHDPKGAERDAGLFASLVSPPDLNDLLSQRYPNQTGPWFVNLDASRLIYEGPIAAGGGHSDIYKDDVAHLCWAVTRLGPLVAPAVLTPATVAPGATSAAGGVAPARPDEGTKVGAGGAGDGQ